jgi:hypothetical protein
VAVKGRAESEIMAVKDQALQTKYHAAKILHTETDSECRLCQQFDETVENIILACPIVAKEQYLKWHNQVCAELYFK